MDGTMKVVCLSDTHCKLGSVKVPDGDMLVHSGDLTFQGTVGEISKELQQFSVIAQKFKLGAYACPGNHDWLAEYNLPLMEQMYKDAGITLLHDRWVVVDGLVVYGSGWTPEFGGWALNVPRGKQLEEKWANIPDKTDVLITHGPPRGILDETPYKEKVGCDDLWRRVLQVRPKLHVFGHIHAGYGVHHFDGMTFVNASTCTERYRPTNEPVVIDLG